MNEVVPASTSVQDYLFDRCVANTRRFNCYVDCFPYASTLVDSDTYILSSSYSRSSEFVAFLFVDSAAFRVSSARKDAIDDYIIVES
jgi:hypothetical protein